MLLRRLNLRGEAVNHRGDVGVLVQLLFAMPQQPLGLLQLPLVRCQRLIKPLNLQQPSRFI